MSELEKKSRLNVDIFEAIKKYNEMEKKRANSIQYVAPVESQESAEEKLLKKIRYYPMVINRMYKGLHIQLIRSHVNKTNRNMIFNIKVENSIALLMLTRFIIGDYINSNYEFDANSFYRNYVRYSAVPEDDWDSLMEKWIELNQTAKELCSGEYILKSDERMEKWVSNREPIKIGDHVRYNLQKSNFNFSRDNVLWGEIGVVTGRRDTHIFVVKFPSNSGSLIADARDLRAVNLEDIS